MPADITTAATSITLARVVALRINVAARPVLVVLLMLVIAVGIGVMMG